MRRSSKTTMILRPKGLENHTFLNLDFETIPDAVWVTAGFIFSYAGVGFKHCFENFSSVPVGAIPGGGAKSILLFGSANVIDNYAGMRYPVEMVTDGAGTDNVIATLGDAGAAVVAPGLGNYECFMNISDIFQQSFFVITDAANTRQVVIGISNGTWVTLSAAAVVQPCIDLPAPVNNQWYHVRVTFNFGTSVSTLHVNHVGSAVTGGSIGGAAADLSNMICMTGFAALGIPTPALVYTARFAAIDFNGVPDYVMGRNQLDLPHVLGNFCAGFNHSESETPNAITPSIAQSATVLQPHNPTVSTSIWISQYAYDHPIFGADIVPNGGFEAGIAGWVAGGIPGVPSIVGSIANDLVNAHTGVRSLDLICGAPTPGFCAATSNPIAVAPGRAYTLSYWAEHTAGADPRFVIAGISFYDATMIGIGALSILPLYPTTAVYVNHRGNIYTPVNCAFIRIHIAALGDAATHISIDDVTLQLADLPWMSVIDVATGNTYFATPVYTGEGWYAVNVQPILTGPNMQIWLNSGCEHGWVLFDSVRID